MLFRHPPLFSLALLASTALAAVPLCNTPADRSCWTGDFNINTDYESSNGIPPSDHDASNPVKYTLTLTEVDNWVGPDGQTKEKAMLINGNWPGTTIEANWGDFVEITVVNNLKSAGNSIHWHGLRQLNNNIYDGVNGVTECPSPPESRAPAPNNTKVYKFQATQYGTSWYHSHYSVQYANGISGSIVIHGPASANYDIDLGAYPVSDWYLPDSEAIRAQIVLSTGAGPNASNTMFNGTNITPPGSSGTGGKYSVVDLTPKSTHLLRLINPSTENHFWLSLAGHNMTIIATDFVPVKPTVVDSLFIGIGQRYDVLITADQPSGNYWFNATYPKTASRNLCGNPNINQTQPAAIFHYADAPSGIPTDTGVDLTNIPCQDVTTYDPVVSRTLPNGTLTSSGLAQNDIGVSPTAANPFVHWNISGPGLPNGPIQVNWSQPILQYVESNDIASIPDSENVLRLDTPGQWSVWLIENKFILPHPMHLHGHDYLILGSGTGTVDISTLSTQNPTRRDTTMLPSGGWLVVAFQVDNPGAWLFHCHIAWHVSQGLSVQFLEQYSSIATSMDLSVVDDTCSKWNNNPFIIPAGDSGLRKKSIPWNA